MQKTAHILEINLISAQNLTKPCSVLPYRRCMKTYAVVWVDPSTKLRTRLDHVGGKNPTWNDKFLFKVSSEFLSSKTSAVSVEIYAAGCFRDKLIGSVRLLISYFLQTNQKTPVFGAFLIRSTSEKFFGILNVGGMVLDASVGFRALDKVSAIDFHDLTGIYVDDKHRTRFASMKFDAKVEDIDCGYLSEAGLRQLSLKQRSEDYGVEVPEKETLSQKKNEESTNMEQSLETNIESHETDEMVVNSDDKRSIIEPEKDVSVMVEEKLNSDSEGSMVKMMIEENMQLKEIVKMIMAEIEEQSTFISDLNRRVKKMERKFLRRNRQRMPHETKEGKDSEIEECMSIIQELQSPKIAMMQPR